MYKKLIFIAGLLLVCIAMMVVALLIDAQTFGQISGYFSILCVLLSLIGVTIMLRNELSIKKKYKQSKKD